MDSAKENISKKVTVRFKPAEYNKLNVSFKTTTKKKLSQYIRFVLLDKPVTVYTRDQSLDNLVAELSSVRHELAAIGNNFNQLVKRLHTASQFEELKSLALESEKQREKFLEKVNEINLKIAQLSSKWWQE